MGDAGLTKSGSFLVPPGAMSLVPTTVRTRVHAPDPFRPRVRVLFGRDGARLELPYDRNLWEPSPDEGPAGTIVAPVDPADYGVDPLVHLAG